MSDYLACAAGCTIRDQHQSTCDGYTYHAGVFKACTGCLPRPAAFGCLCPAHWYRLVDAITAWSVLEANLDRYDVLSPREDGLTRSPQGPRVPLPQTFLAADEVRSWLASAPLDARSWVSTIDGAVQAVGFTKAVESAGRAHQIEEKPHRLHRMRCPNPVHGDQAPFLVWMPPVNPGDLLEVVCDCGYRVTEEDRWTAYRRTVDGWEKYERPALDVIADFENTKGRTA